MGFMDGFPKGKDIRKMHILRNQDEASKFTPSNSIDDYETFALSSDGFMQEEPVVEQELDFEGIW